MRRKNERENMENVEEVTMTRKKCLLRTMMFVPGHIEKLMGKASKCDADALVLDLEDSCKPNSNKEVARQVIRKSVESGLFDKFQVFVRVNPRGTGFLMKDVMELTLEGITGFLYPMAKSAADIIFFSELLSEIEMMKGFESGKFLIFPVIETGGGVLNAREICAVSERVVALGFGSEDFTQEMESIRDSADVSIFAPRALIAFGARAEGVIPIDTPHVNIHDLEGLERHCTDSKTLGYGGIQILHPKEIEIAHKVFSPGEQEMEDAREMIRLAEEAEKEDRGVVVMNGKFIGPPLVKKARKVIALADLIIQHNEKRRSFDA